MTNKCTVTINSQIVTLMYAYYTRTDFMRIVAKNDFSSFYCK